MNLFLKIIFWSFTIGLGFVSPVISFVMVLLYFLPGIIPNLCNNHYNMESREGKSKTEQTRIKEYSKDTLEENR